MKNIWLMILYTIRESISRKTFITLIVISSLAILINYFIAESFLSSYMLQMKEMKQDINANLELVYKNYLWGFISAAMSLILIISLVLCSSFMPTLLEKGTIDLFLSKPISRTEILFGRLFGGTAIVFINFLYLILGIWIVTSLIFSTWNFSILYLIFNFTFVFFIINSVLIFFGVVTKNTTITMISTFAIFFIFVPMLAGRDKFIPYEKKLLKALADFLYYIFPKTDELLGQLNRFLILNTGEIDYQSLLSTIVFTVVVIWLSIYSFVKQDY